MVRRRKIKDSPDQMEMTFPPETEKKEKYATIAEIMRIINSRDHFINELNFDSGSEKGYNKWQDENKNKLREISDCWGYPLFKRVRIKLNFLPSEIQGFLVLLEFPPRMDRRKSLKLRLNFSGNDLDFGEKPFIDFESFDIETLKKI